MNHSFLQAFQITSGDVVSIVGAGGKSSLMYRLAEEARCSGLGVLITTSTRLFIPKPDQYDAIDLSGSAFSEISTNEAGIYVAGVPDSESGKMRGISAVQIDDCKNKFNLIFIEADGSARKPLKGWKDTEPVIFPQTTVTIGVLDIQTVGQVINNDLVHRLDHFLALTGSVEGQKVSLSHLETTVTDRKGLFSKAQGKQQLLVNKVESMEQRANAYKIREQLGEVQTVVGSVYRGIIYD